MVPFKLLNSARQGCFMLQIISFECSANVPGLIILISSSSNVVRHSKACMFLVVTVVTQVTKSGWYTHLPMSACPTNHTFRSVAGI